jgi:D-ribose pyranose/furanose isomerase RbsD
MAWRDQAAEAVASLGHRNWIVVADAAYPVHADPGIQTLMTGESIDVVLTWVQDALAKAEHVAARAWVDAELALVPDADVPSLGNVPIEVRPHEEIIEALDAAAKRFRVLVLKTNHRVAYTSVFFELGCGYWSADQETELRKRMEKGQ